MDRRVPFSGPDRDDGARSAANGEDVLATGPELLHESPIHLVRTVAPARIALVGTYPPRRCGIATFTHDLAGALTSTAAHVVPVALAVTDPGGSYDYPPEVRYEIRQGVKSDYARAAEFLNYSDLQLVLIQHEYGIYGGDDGAYILDLLAVLRLPALVTLHTVLKTPSEQQRSIVRKMAERTAGLVVMSHTAANLLIEQYGIAADKIHIIAHGIPPLEVVDREALRAKFGVGGHRMLLTFGLLGPGKGIETVIRALPALVAEFPNLLYFVVGATHPMVVRRHGEAYRTMLTREAAKLGVAEHVVFRDQFVSAVELSDYLRAAEIFVSPYLNEAQVTSGALSYAMGAGAAAVSTPYWHARELLAEGRGRLFPFGDSAALTDILAGLLRSPSELAALQSAAFTFTRPMLWPSIGEAYLALARAVALKSEPSARAHPPARTLAAALPELRLDHLVRLTDDTGIIQHATFSVPARRTGYCVDDNARALIVALGARRLQGSPETLRLVDTYLGYLHFSQEPDGTFHNFLGYDRRFVPGEASHDCIGRAIWALGTAVRLADDEGHQRLARQMLAAALTKANELGPRGTAASILGLTAFLSVGPHGEARALHDALAAKLVRWFAAEATDAWSWFEPTLTYDNALLPLALFRAHALTGNAEFLRIAQRSLAFLEDACFSSGRLVLVGNAGWHSRGGARADSDEQPTDAAAFVLAFHAAYLVSGAPQHLHRMRESFAWFFGSNRLGAALYDSGTAGCRDGLGAVEANQNEGAESTIAFLLALLDMLELAGERLEPDELRTARGN